MAQIGHRMAKVFAARCAVNHGAVTVAVFLETALIYYFLVFFEINVDFLQKVFGQVEFRENVAAVNLYVLHLLLNFLRVGDGLGMGGEKLVHFLLAFEVFLLGIAEASRALGSAHRVVYIGIGGKADEPVVYRTILFAYKVGVVGGYHLHIMLGGELENFFGIEFLP